MNVQQTVEPRSDPASSGPPPDMAETLGLGRARGRWGRRAVVLLLVGVFLLAVGYFLLVRDGGAEGAARYQTEPARLGAVTEMVVATGTVQPTNKVEISSELSGTVRQVLADYNDPVSADQVIAVLDTDKLEAETSHARAALAVAKAQTQQAEATLGEAEQANARTRALTEKDFASQATRDAAEATYRRALAGVAVARANVEVAEATLLTAETNLAKASIRSPIDGVVLHRVVEPGQTVAASLQAPVLFTIAEDLASMQLEVDIDEADVGNVRAGQPASFTVDAFRNRTFRAEVAAVRYAPVTVNNVVTYTAVLSFDNSELLLRPGMTATATVVTQHVDDALLVPNAALRFSPPEEARAERRGGVLSMLLPRPPPAVEVARPEEAPDGTRPLYVLRDEKPERISVRTGISDGSWTEVVDGPLEAGTRVVTDAVQAN